MLQRHGSGDVPREWATSFQAIKEGETATVSWELERLLGREPEGFDETVRRMAKPRKLQQYHGLFEYGKFALPVNPLTFLIISTKCFKASIFTVPDATRYRQVQRQTKDFAVFNAMPTMPSRVKRCLLKASEASNQITRSTCDRFINSAPIYSK